MVVGGGGSHVGLYVYGTWLEPPAQSSTGDTWGFASVLGWVGGGWGGGGGESCGIVRIWHMAGTFTGTHTGAMTVASV